LLWSNFVLVTAIVLSSLVYLFQVAYLLNTLLNIVDKNIQQFFSIFFVNGQLVLYAK